MLNSEILKQIRRLQIYTGRQVANLLAGEYLSTFKGQGMEFEEVRPYTPGDDVRAIDWNVTARMGEPYIKCYVEERELTVLLAVDISSSLEFGSAVRSKRETAAELAAFLAFSAIQNNDKIGLLLFHSQPETFIPPRKGQKHALRIVREVLAHPNVQKSTSPSRLKRIFARSENAASRSTNLASALQFCQKVLHRKVVLFFISDFLDSAYLVELRRAHQKHDVIAVWITDPKEKNLPSSGLVTFQDAETGEMVCADTGARGFQNHMQVHSQSRTKQLAQELRASRVDLIEITTDGSSLTPLVHFFHMRQKRSRQ